MKDLSVVVLVKNEENNILDCLETIQDVDDIIIIDDFSEDRTEELIKNLKNNNIKIFKRKLDSNFSNQRNFGLAKAKYKWILFLDADERLTPELKAEIEERLDNSKVDGYFLKRKDFMWGRKLLHGESGNIKLLRLAKKDAGKWIGEVHEVWDVKGNLEVLTNDILHFPHPTISSFIDEISHYSSIRALELHRGGKKTSLFSIIAYPKAKFLLNYFIRMGFLDGTQGFVFAVMMSLHSFLVRAKLWLLQK